MLIAEDIHKGYNHKEILRGVSLTITPGEITAVIGPSGAGKSTLIRTLSLLDPPDRGVIKLDSISYSFPSSRSNGLPKPWPRMTVVFQQLFLWPHLTLKENIDLPLKGLTQALEPCAIQSLTESFELQEIMDRYPNQVSLGQRQRAALIRAIALNPKYLLLDEITSALDVEHVAKVLSQLERLKQRGTGILVVTHLIGFAKSAADQVVFLDNGSIVEIGRNSILEKPANDRLARFLSLVEIA